IERVVAAAVLGHGDELVALSPNLTVSQISVSVASSTAWATRERRCQSGHQSPSHCCNRVRNVAFRPQRRILWAGNLRVRQIAGTPSWGGGNRLSLGDQESVGRNAKGGVMVEAAPSPSFKMSQPDLLLEFLIVAFDPPSQLGNVDELTECDVFRKRRQPIFDRLLLAFGPFNQQPLLRPTVGEPVIPMRDTNAHTGKSRGQFLPRGFLPYDRAPGTLWQGQCKLLDRGRLVLVIAAQQLRWSPMTRPLRWRTRPCARCPYGRV